MTLSTRHEIFLGLLLVLFGVFVSYRQAERNAWLRSITESQDYRNGYEDQQNAYLLSTLSKKPSRRHHRRTR